MHTFPGINWFSSDVSQRSGCVGVDGLVLQQVSPESIPDERQNPEITIKIFHSAFYFNLQIKYYQMLKMSTFQLKKEVFKLP